MKERVVLIGASADPEKYSNKAFHLLKENGHEVVPVHPTLKSLEGVSVYPSIGDVPGPVDTVTMYVSKEVSAKIAGAILKKAPKRIIFNPGAENPDLAAEADKAGIRVQQACTLVLLRTNQFEK